MKVRLKPGLCVGHARCAAVAPEVYDLDDEGFNRVEERLIPDDLRAKALRGARACPERALVVEDDEAGE